MKVNAICDIDEDRLLEIQKKYGVPFTTSDYREVLERDDVDVAAVFTPDHHHAGQCIDAMASGKHVFVTKPMVTNMRDCKTVIKTVRETGLTCLVGETVRFHALNLKVKELLDSGIFGKPVYIEAHYVHDLRPVYRITPWRVSSPQDLLLGGGCHPIDHVRWYFGDIEEVHCYSNRSGLTSEYPLNENFTLNLKFKNGAIGRILDLHGCVEPPMPMLGLMMCGTKGTVCNNELVFEKNGVQVKDTLEESREIKMARNGISATDQEKLCHLEEVIRCLRHLRDCILHGIKPVPDAVEGAKTIAVALAAWESLRKKDAVKVRTNF